MINLYNLLKETKGEEEYPPYMFSPVGFGCHVCEYYYKEDDKHMCRNEHYIEYKGTSELIDEEGNQIKDPSKWCSNWFHPKEEEEKIDEMADTDPDFKMIMSKYESGTDEERSMISAALGLGFKSNSQAVYRELRNAGKEDMEYIKDQLGIQDLEEACWDGYRQLGVKKKGNRTVPNCVRIKEEKKKPKIKKAYLTKDAGAMKREIDRVKKLSDDDPSAYRKWDADYSDKAKTKKYKTKKSVATTAYEKRFGKKEK